MWIVSVLYAMPTPMEADPKGVDGTSVPTTIKSVNMSDKEVTAKDTNSVASHDLLDAEPEPFKFTDWLFRRHETKTIDLDSTATRRSVYDDPYLAEHYWPKSDYENIHRFDPKARWTLREERVGPRVLFLEILIYLCFLQALVRKLDWKVILLGRSM